MLEKKTVLAIDDDPDVLEIVKSTLSPYYQVETGFSSKECLDFLAKSTPDLIVLDVMMTHLGEGLDCVRDIKLNPATKHIPVLMMTSVNEVYDYRKQIDESFFPYDRWLDKPVKPDLLLKNVREMLAPADR